MATTDKLNRLKQTKADLKAALIEKGQTPGDVFADYPAKVRAIKTGGGGTDVSGVTAAASDVRKGKVFVDSTGAEKEGTQPTRGSADVTLANSKVTVPAGIYDQQVQVDVPVTEQATPVIEVSNSGLITATAGDKSATKQLSTQSGKTITPGPTEQIAVAAGKYVTGDVIVAAVQSGGGGEQGSAIIINGPSVSMWCEASVSSITPIFEHQVVSVDGATYGFELNDAGYYESQNKGVKNSYAMCKIVFNSNYYKQVSLKCINYAQKGYDYGLISNVDTMLSMDNVADSEGVLKSFESTNSSSTNTVSTLIPPGEHFICIKFIKNGSTNSNNDSLQFMVT